jgi:hypothetical protein
MKEETFVKAKEIRDSIDRAEHTQAILHETTTITFGNPRHGTLGSIYPMAEKTGVFSGSLPEEINEKIKSEALRFISRCKRILDNYEFNLKQDLEDL